MERVIVRCRGLSGYRQRLPSDAFNCAIVSLAHTDEMQPLLCEASLEGKALAVEIFFSREGRPILIYFTKEAL